VKNASIPREAVIVPPQSVSDQVYEVLKEQILLGRIALGERMIAGATAEALQTSRTPVREAFQRLVQDGLAERLVQGGVRVTMITPQRIREIFGIRAVLETYAVELACDNVDARTIRELKDLARRARRLLATPDANRPEGWIALWRLNTAFHETLCGAAGSEYLIKLLNQMKDLVMRYRLLSMKKSRMQACDDHELMIRHLENRDKVNLRELMKSHVEMARSDALKSLASGEWEKDV
jgi:GntR family transcriptional regulator, rspAB operon transcriptional repressor